MKKIYTAKLNTSVAPNHRSFRRLVRKMFASFIKSQNCNQREIFEDETIRLLRDIQEMIEIIARQMARCVKQDK